MTNLFDPLTIRSITIRNRIGVSPMCQYCYEDGFSNDWQLVHLGARAAGGAGLIIAEATAVEARGRITPHDAGIWKDDHIPPLRKVTRFIKEQGAVPGIQIAHAGRKANTHRPWDGGSPITMDDPQFWQVVGASPIAFADGYQTPQELTTEEIHAIAIAFRHGAERALQAGFEFLEIHAAHGYLLHSFLSPLSNHRSDQYGGSFANRIRLLLEVIGEVRKVWQGHLPLAVRISATDWVENGWTITESVELARLFIPAGVDVVDCSSGGNLPKAPVPVGPGYQVPFSEAIRSTGVMTAAVGLITAPAQADQIIRNQQADIVLLGREMLRNPSWALHAAHALRQAPPVPPQYLRGF